MRRAHKNGFTIVELLIVIVVIAILAAIALVSYTGIQERARTARSVSTADQVRTKALAWNAMQSGFPNLAQLRTNSLDPVDMDTPGGGAGPEEAKLSSPDVAMGAPLNVERANDGLTVYYEPCNDGTGLSGAVVMYWDYTTKSSVTATVGSCS